VIQWTIENQCMSNSCNHIPSSHYYHHTSTQCNAVILLEEYHNATTSFWHETRIPSLLLLRQTDSWWKHKYSFKYFHNNILWMHSLKVFHSCQMLLVYGWTMNLAVIVKNSWSYIQGLSFTVLICSSVPWLMQIILQFWCQYGRFMLNRLFFSIFSVFKVTVTDKQSDHMRQSILVNFIWTTVHKFPLVVPPSCWRHIFAGWGGFVGISKTEGYAINTFTAKVDCGRFKYLRFNLPQSTLVNLKFTLLFCLK
jgi:hypothetical protein